MTNMKQVDFFALATTKNKDTGLPEALRHNPAKTNFRTDEPMECGMRHMSECEGDLYMLSLSTYRCARHITLQRMWCNGTPTMDLIDWIHETGDALLEHGLYAVDNLWRLVEAK